MAQLTAKKLRDTEQSTINRLQATGAVFEGSALGLSVGGARQLVAGDAFLGFAREDAAVTEFFNVDPPGQGDRIVLDVIGASGSSINASVYASDGDTFTLTSTSNTLIGTLLRHITGTTVVVQT